MQKSYKFVICKHHSLILLDEMLTSHLIIKLESKETQKKPQGIASLIHWKKLRTLFHKYFKESF